MTLTMKLIAYTAVHKLIKLSTSIVWPCLLMILTIADPDYHCHIKAVDIFKPIILVPYHMTHAISYEELTR